MQLKLILNMLVLEGGVSCQVLNQLLKQVSRFRLHSFLFLLLILIITLILFIIHLHLAPPFYATALLPSFVILLNRPLVIQYFNISFLRTSNGLLASSILVPLLLARLYILLPRYDPSLPHMMLSLLLLLVLHYLFIILIIFLIIFLLLAIVLVAVDHLVVPPPLESALRAPPVLALLPALLLV